MTEEMQKKVQALLDSIQNDMVMHGDILSRETLRLADEVRLAISRLNRAEAKK